MIINHQQFDLLGKKVLEKVVFTTPLREPRTMDEEACFLYNVKGHFELYSAVEKVPLPESQGLVMRCGNYLTNYHNKDGQPSEAIAVHFYPEVLTHIYKDGLPPCLSLNHHSTDFKPQIAAVEMDMMFENYIRSLQFYFDSPSLVNEELITLKVKELIMLLVNSNSPHSQKVKGILKNLFNPYEVAFKELIQTHLFESLSLEELAALANLSLSTFKRKFQQIYQETPGRYLRQQKLIRASELLTSSELRVKDICYDCGFNDVTSFTKLFTAHFGSSPTKYRSTAMD